MLASPSLLGQSASGPTAQTSLPPADFGDAPDPYPTGASETFAETLAYFWARYYCQWLKPALDEQGMLPSSATDYTRVLIITDACIDRSFYSRAYAVTTEDNKGEDGRVIALAHVDPTNSDNYRNSCADGGCFRNPNVIHHELTHFFLHEYVDVDYELDCDGGNQLMFTHEGIVGSVLPHACWNNAYSVGYYPGGRQYLYNAGDTDSYRVHHDESTRLTVGDCECEDSSDDSYKAGRVVGQPLWEFYHGVWITSTGTENIIRPATDADFIRLVLWAADLQSASTKKDRKQFANRVMEILDKHSNWSSSDKHKYCEIFKHHGLTRINSDYCD